MTCIPGLNFCPTDSSGEGIEIPTFTGKTVVPNSYWQGHCRTVREYEKINTISKGSFGVMYTCKRKETNEYYILKELKIPDGSGIPSSVLREITLLSTLQHDNIISYYGVVAGEINKNYVILYYCPVSLNDLIQKGVDAIYSCDVVKCIMRQLFQGLIYIHETSIVHRDIKEENILFTQEGILKISGFNASRYHTTEDMTPNVSDLTYRAPELLYQAKKYTSAVDMWSTGCVFAKLLLQKPLFYGGSELEVLRSIFDVLGTPSETLWPGFVELFSKMTETYKIMEEGRPYNDIKHFFSNQPLSCQDLVKDLLIYYPKARLSAKDCIKSTYITEAPNGCSLAKLSSILQTVLPPKQPQKEVKMDIDYSLS